MLSKEEIASRLGTHEATTEGENPTAPKHSALRDKFTEFVEWLDQNVPDGRAKSVMHTSVETASMWAHKAVAELAPLVDKQ